MPRPAYIICAHYLSEDKTTNLLSIFGILEKVEVHVQELGDFDDDGDRRHAQGVLQGMRKSQVTRVVAVWMSESGDENESFEHAFAIRNPHEAPSDVELIGLQPFAFERTKLLRRFSLNMQGFPSVRESCILEFESRVRRVGEDEWEIQSYPLVFEVIDARANESPQPMDDTAGR